MRVFDINSSDYIVCDLSGYALNEALRLWKTKFQSIQRFKAEIIHRPYLKELEKFADAKWESIIPISIEEAFKEQNMEKRRVMFDCIGTSQLFSSLNPILLDKQTLSKTRIRWDKSNQPYVQSYDDTYELYELDGDKLFPRERVITVPIYAVRCLCATTSREYWIYVPSQIVKGSRYQKPDAIRAIAWTIQIDVTKPKRIFRQGDVIIVELSPDSTETNPYHLSKDDYLNLMYSET